MNFRKTPLPFFSLSVLFLAMACGNNQSDEKIQENITSRLEGNQLYSGSAQDWNRTSTPSGA